MKTMRFSLQIDVPRQRVWQVLWDETTFSDWTSPFADGARLETDWRQGGRFEYTEAQSDTASYGEIERLEPERRVIFQKLGETRAGADRPLERPRREEYRLDGADGATKLSLQIEVPEEQADALKEALPQALERIRALATAPEAKTDTA